MISPSLD